MQSVHIYKYMLFGEVELIALTEEEHLLQQKDPDQDNDTTYLGRFIKQED